MSKPRPTRPPNKIGRGGKRRTLGWTLITLGLLVAAVWVWSGWWYTWWVPGGHWRADVGRGRFVIWRDAFANEERPWAVSSQSPPDWLWERPIYRRHANSADSEMLVVCFWPIPLLLWTPAALLLRSGILARRRAVKGMCAKCGYSLAGLGDGGGGAVCPECGKGAGTK